MGASGAREGRCERRVHVNLGPTCNNNCIFCMEDDRETRRRVNGALGPAEVRAILVANRGADEVCFTSGEPTLVAELPRYVALARELGYPRRSLMTNGRRLMYAAYCQRLVSAGVNFFYVSIHGHTARLHDGLVRTPGAFEQTLAGIDNVAAHAPSGVTLHASTVVTSRNLAHLRDIYLLLVSRGARQVVFDVMQPHGRAHTHFDRLFPSYGAVAAQMGSFLSELGEQAAPAFLVDIPLCATEGLCPDFNRGYVEHYVHFESTGDGLLEVARSELDDRERAKRPECGLCRYDASCAGVWRNYLARFGWEGLEPVTGTSTS